MERSGAMRVMRYLAVGLLLALAGGNEPATGRERVSAMRSQVQASA